MTLSRTEQAMVDVMIVKQERLTAYEGLIARGFRKADPVEDRIIESLEIAASRLELDAIREGSRR